MEVIFVGCLGPGIRKPSGVSTYVENILRELQNLGIDATLVGVGPSVSTDLPYKFISLSPIDGHTSYGFMMRLIASNPSLDLPTDSIVNVHRPDDLIPFLFLRKENPTVITLHGTHFRNVYLKRGRIVGKTYDLLERFSVERAHQLIAVSRRSKELFLRRYPEKDTCIHYIPPGVNRDIFRKLDRAKSRLSWGFDEDDFLVLYAGRIDREKRLDLLFKALPHLQRKIPTAKLLIAGEGGYASRLKSMAGPHIGEDIHMLGYVQQARMPELMSASDVFCLPSMHEGFPSVILEALSCGLPVVSTRVGDVQEVVQEGVSGSIVDAPEPKEIANRISEVGSRRDSMAPNCLRIARGYSWRKVAELTARIYREVLPDTT